MARQDSQVALYSRSNPRSTSAWTTTLSGVTTSILITFAILIPPF